MKTCGDAVAEIRALLVELKNDPESWENPTLDRFLDAMAAWLEASNKKEAMAPSWDMVIAMLHAAKYYE